jgi:acetylornithine/succinyldiaminopimelate/putrescine aminotransferase
MRIGSVGQGNPEVIAMSEPSSRKQRALSLAGEYVVPGRVKAFQAMGIPLVIGRREGYRIWDLDGHELIDLHLNGGTFNLGHRNPDIVCALHEAADRLDIGNHHFPSESRAECAELLASSTPGDLHYTVFTSSGSEAVDVAIKSARWATGRSKIVSIDGGYHGATGLSGAVGDDANARYFLSDDPEQLPRVPFDDLDAIQKALAEGDVAAVVLETIPATSGFPMPSEGYLQGVKDLCTTHGSLYIADEVQTGLGRTGERWGVDCYGVEPDVLVTAKGLSGGMYPIAASVLSRRAGGWLDDNAWGHVSTFGGSEIGCEVAKKVLEICFRPETLANAREMSAYLERGIADIRTRHPVLSELRCKGLVMALGFDRKDGALSAMKALYESGIWAIFAAYDERMLQWKPGLLIDRPLCDEILGRLEDGLRRLEAMPDP